VWSPDGRYLYGSTYYTGVSNIVRYDTERRVMEWISNTERGLFRPVPISGDSLIAFEFTTRVCPGAAGGRHTEDVSAVTYLGQQIAEKYPLVQSWKLPPPSAERINVDSLIIASGEYEASAPSACGRCIPPSMGTRARSAGRPDGPLRSLLLHNLDFTVVYTRIPASI